MDPGVPNPPGVSAGVRAGVRLVLMFCEKPEFRLCVMPEIIILVCSVVRVRPLLYTEEHSALRDRRSSRSFDTLHSKRNNDMRCLNVSENSVCYLCKRMHFVPLDKLICEGEFPIQKNLDVHHLLSEDVLTLQKVAGNLSFI